MLDSMLMTVSNQFMTLRIFVIITIIVSAEVTVCLTGTLNILGVMVVFVVAIFRECFAAGFASERKCGSNGAYQHDKNQKDSNGLFHDHFPFIKYL